MTDASETPCFGRRALLSGAAAATLGALAGCSGGVLDDDPPTIPRSDLRAAVDGDTPTVPEALPIDIEASFIEEQRGVARSKLDGVPVPFDETEIPNGVIRERLNGAYEGALRSLRNATDAPTPSERLRRAAGARADAREVQAGWAAIDGDLTAADLRQSVPDVEADVGTLVDRHTYVGDDPVRAAVVHDEIERRIGGARRWVPGRGWEFTRAETALDLADIAVDIERARADVEAGVYLLDRFRNSLGAATDQRDRLIDTRATLEARIDDRGDSVPAERVDDATSLVDRDIESTAGIKALERLGGETSSRIEQVRRADSDESSPASNVVSATPILTHLRAFERLRDRIEGGDDVAVDIAEDVAAFRSNAVAAVESAGEADQGRVLVDAFRPMFAREIGWTDNRFGDGPEAVRVDSVSYYVADYVRIAALCSELPAAAETVAGVLRESG